VYYSIILYQIENYIFSLCYKVTKQLREVASMDATKTN